MLRSIRRGHINLGESSTADRIKVWAVVFESTHKIAQRLLSEINRYMRKYRKRKQAQSTSLPPQRGRPSWASNRTGPLPSTLKRKVSNGGYEGDFKRIKEETNDADADANGLY